MYFFNLDLTLMYCSIDHKYNKNKRMLYFILYILSNPTTYNLIKYRLNQTIYLFLKKKKEKKEKQLQFNINNIETIVRRYSMCKYYYCQVII